ncbi:hypothetical protein ACJ6WF_21845 [Streptomyces sp. MMS24-I2-30]|uniref:hypothetical protein n=1 Tax=Streptomyces sp. MMS24-I2-30 TaxID=3351564 RepID=UPI003896AB87
MSASLREYLDGYAAGQFSREEMLAALASWPFEEEEFDPAHTFPVDQDNTASVLHAALLLDRISDDDYAEIFRRRNLRKKSH